MTMYRIQRSLNIINILIINIIIILTDIFDYVKHFFFCNRFIMKLMGLFGLISKREQFLVSLLLQNSFNSQIFFTLFTLHTASG